MDTTERARLRALLRGITRPWAAVDRIEDGEAIAEGTVVVCPGGDDFPPDEVAIIDMGFDDGCDEAHAALIVGAVNALPMLLDALDAADARATAAERERDEARAEVERLRAESEERLRTIQRVAEAVAAEPPMDLVARVRWQVAEVERLRHRLGRVIVAADQIPQHLGATWWGQRLRAALVPPATEVPDDRARGTGGAT